MFSHDGVFGLEVFVRSVRKLPKIPGLHWLEKEFLWIMKQILLFLANQRLRELINLSINCLQFLEVSTLHEYHDVQLLNRSTGLYNDL